MVRRARGEFLSWFPLAGFCANTRVLCASRSDRHTRKRWMGQDDNGAGDDGWSVACAFWRLSSTRPLTTMSTAILISVTVAMPKTLRFMSTPMPMLAMMRRSMLVITRESKDGLSGVRTLLGYIA